MTYRAKMKKKIKEFERVKKHCENLKRENKTLEDRIVKLNAYKREEMMIIGEE